MISVILCNYNYGRYISFAIESVLSQTYPDFELIIVDDGSTDNSREVISSFTDHRIVRVFQDNGGQAAAFNAGFSQASGELIAFLDSDDGWMEKKLEVVRNTFDQLDHGGGSGKRVALVQHGLEVIDADSALVGKQHYTLRPGLRDVYEDYFAENHTGFFYPSSSLTCRKRFLDRIYPLDECWRICADVAFTRPLPLFGMVYTLGETLGYYRIHEANTWMNSHEQSLSFENQKRYVEYTNEWLEKLGHSRTISFHKSKLYKKLKLRRLLCGRILQTVRRAAVNSPIYFPLRSVYRSMLSTLNNLSWSRPDHDRDSIY